MGYTHSARPSRLILLVGALLGATAIGLGAWGTHGLRGLVEAEAHRSFMVGVRYQLIHAVLIVAIGWSGASGRMSGWIVSALAVGTVLFSGSIYGLVLTEGLWWLGPVTPIGGLVLILGWLLLAFRAARQLFFHSV